MRGLPIFGWRTRVVEAPAQTLENWSLADRPYTPAMRRFVCVAAILFGFAGDRYVWSVRPRLAVPVVQPVRLAEAGGTVRGPAWWRP